MSSTRFIDGDRPTHEEVEAAARQLYMSGDEHGWWPDSVSDYDSLDPVGREEFDAIVERILMSAAAAKRKAASGSS
jgi:hypothetical protein